MKQFIYLFSGLLLLFASTPRVVAQEIGDYSQLNDEEIFLPCPFYSKMPKTILSMSWQTLKQQ